MKTLIKRYILLWLMVLVSFNVVVLLLQYMIPTLDIYRGDAIETTKNLIISSQSIPSDVRDEATRALLGFQSTVYGIFIFNFLMIIQLILFILQSRKIKDKDDVVLNLPLFMLSRKFMIITVIISLVFSLVRNIPTYVAIVISFIFIIYIFIQYNNYGLQKEYVEDLEKKMKERKNK